MPVILRLSQEWTHDKLKRFLEGGTLPNLYYAIEFALDEAVQDVILIQGSVSSMDNANHYAGPSYLPSSLRKMKLPVGETCVILCTIVLWFNIYYTFFISIHGFRFEQRCDLIS